MDPPCVYWGTKSHQVMIYRGFDLLVPYLWYHPMTPRNGGSPEQAALPPADQSGKPNLLPADEQSAWRESIWFNFNPMSISKTEFKEPT